MTIETKWLVKLLDAYINEAGVDLPASFSYEKLYEAAREHSVIPIIFQELYRLDHGWEKGSRESLESFKKSYISAVYLSSLQDFGVEELEEKLAEQGIEYIPVKGYVINEYYGAAGFFRIFWYKVWILSLIPDKINIIKMKEGILKCLQILHLIYNDFIQMSLK